MIRYPYYFPTELQEAAEAVGKSFPLEEKTEQEIQQLWDLWVAAEGIDFVEFVRRYVSE